MEAHKFANIFPMIEGEELERLKEDIKEHGLLQPVILYEDKILDGRNRYKACNEIGIKPEFKTYEGNKPLEFVISLNLKRRHLTPEQRAGIGVNVMPLVEEEAKKRQGARTDLNPNITQKIGESKKKKHDRESAVIVGKQFDVNPEYIRKMKILKETKPEIFNKVMNKETTLQEIKKDDRLEKIKVQRAELQREVLEQPKGDYDVIVIDPPWRYDGDKYIGRDDDLPIYEPEGFRGSAPYPTMSLEEIKNIKLPIKDDCVLWLWTTNLFLPDCYPLLEAWGFELKSMVTWDKQHIGTGRWLRSQTEHCLLAIRGKPFFQNTKWSTLISEKKTEHSVKPEIFYKMVDEICAGRKLDYFARKKREGWDVYGDEVK